MTMRSRDLRRRETDDLTQEVVRLSDEIFQQRFRGQSEEVVDRGMVRRTRRDIARIRTILRERQLGLNEDLTAQARESGKKGAK